MERTILFTSAACDLEPGDYVSILGGCIEGTVTRPPEDVGDTDVRLYIQDEDEHGDVTEHVVDAFERIDVIGY